MGHLAHSLRLTKFKGIGEESKIIAQLKHRKNLKQDRTVWLTNMSLSLYYPNTLSELDRAN